jgi:arylsulfatase A-like enzyme
LSVIPLKEGFSSEQRRGPNIVLFLVDDMGWKDSTAYGSTYYETPHMQRFQTEGMQFTDAYALPLCSPTRASIMTGQYSARHGITSASGHQPPAAEGASPYPASGPANKKFLYAASKNYLDPKLTTIAELLKAAGYRTGHFGKWHLGLNAEHRPDKHGFETVFHAAPDPGPPSYFSPYGVHSDGKPSSQHKVGNITDGPKGEYITDRLTDEALKFIETHKEQPFYLNLWHYGVHGPWGHKAEYTAQFAKTTDRKGLQGNPIMASMLKSIDESLGRVMAKLDELGLAENTLFIFYSDNGGNTHSNTPSDRTAKNLRPGHPKLAQLEDWKKWAGDLPPTNNAPLREGKGRIYEGGQRVPLMIRWPGKIKSGSLTSTVVGPIDLFPTILDAVGLPKPEGHIVDGVSILPILKGTGTIEREAYFTWFPHQVPAVSVRQGDWKLIHRFEPHPTYPETRELYNLQQDIGETNNLAAKMPEKVRALNGLIERFIEDTRALAPRPNPAYDPRETTAQDANDDKTAGLVPRMCKLSVRDGALRIDADGRAPFVGIGQLRQSAGPITLKLRARSQTGGTGKVLWKTAEQDAFPETGQSAEYKLEGGTDWQDVTVSLPVEGQVGIVRLYLPANVAAVEMESLEFSAGKTNQTLRKWDFAKTP